MDVTKQNFSVAENVAQLLERTLRERGTHTAIQFPSRTVSYDELASHIAFVQAHITITQKVAILASRSLASYLGVLGSAYCGATYIPLNKRFPPERKNKILNNTNCDWLVVGEECADQLEDIILSHTELKFLCPEPGPELERLSEKYPNRQWIFPNKQYKLRPPQDFNSSQSIYILFTSGTTGEPKGIVVEHGNIVSYLNNFQKHYPILQTDRVSQIFDTSFDVSVHDIFAAICAGATLCIIPEEAVMAPDQYIREYELTTWFSVPSVPIFMNKFRMLKENAFPSLRLCCFAGEAMPSRTMSMWQQATPNALCVNMYGPTETTIVMSHFPWKAEYEDIEFENGIVPIGEPFSDTPLLLVDKLENELSNGEAGELLIGGPHVTQGYLNNQELTEKKYITLEKHPETRWYRSGDLVKKTKHSYEFQGRVDDQIQLRGFRIELIEIDKAIRTAAGHELAIAVPIQLKGGSAEDLYAVVQGDSSKEARKAILAACKQLLPDYMVPSKVKFVEQMPLNINGKIDRKTLSTQF